MDLKLKVSEGKNAGKEIPVRGAKFFIGRAEDCQLRPGSELISRHHCAILLDDAYVGVRDFGSKNGTYVNDERVIGERELKAGDRLTVGPLLFEVMIDHGLAAKKRPPVADIKDAAERTAQAAAKDPMDVSQWLAGDNVDANSSTSTVTQTGGGSLLAPKPEPKPAAAQQPAAAPQAAPQPAPAKPAPKPAPASLTDTQPINTSVTQTLVPAAPAAATEVAESPPPEEAGKPRGPAGKRTPGKLPTSMNTTKDSQEAAAAMLNRLRKRR